MYASIIRTLVPFLAGLLLTWALRLGVKLEEDIVVAFVQMVITGGYYAGFRWLETHLSSGWGWFLGLARPPVYDDEGAAGDTA